MKLSSKPMDDFSEYEDGISSKSSVEICSDTFSCSAKYVLTGTFSSFELLPYLIEQDVVVDHGVLNPFQRHTIQRVVLQWLFGRCFGHKNFRVLDIRPRRVELSTS